jgi:hypothetical protein
VSKGESADLADGKFVRLEVDGDVAYGDVDGDGQDEAVVHTVCTYGANGVQDTIQVWDLDGGSAEVKAKIGEPPESVSGPLPSKAKKIAIDPDGTIAVTWTHYGPDDPECCPSTLTTVHYLVTGDQVTPVGTNQTVAAPPVPG